MSMFTEGVKSAPANNTVLADTGALANDVSDGAEIRIIVSSAALCAIAFEHLDTDGTTVLHSHTFAVPANGNFVTMFVQGAVQNQRYRLRMASTVLVGTVQGTITEGFF